MLFDSVHVFAKGLEAASLDGPELRIRYGIGILMRIIEELKVKII